MTRYVPTRADFDNALTVIMTVARFENPKVDFSASGFTPLTQAAEKLKRYRDFMTPVQPGAQPKEPRPRGGHRGHRRAPR